METKASFLKALPVNCFLSDEPRILCQVFMFELLKEKMSDEEIIAGHEERQPFLDKMRAITCRGCNIVRCQHNFKFAPAGFDVLQNLMNGQWIERINKADKLFEELLSAEERSRLEKHGINFRVNQMASRKNPKLFISFTKDEKEFYIVVEVGARLLSVNGETEKLTSIDQLRGKVLGAKTFFA